MLIGYMRPYQSDVNCEVQLQQLTEKHCEKVFVEEHSSAKKRTELEHLINNLKQGDKLIVTKLYILADSTLHLVEVLDAIKRKGAFFQSLQEEIDTSSPHGYPFHDMVEALAAFQRDVISENTKRGLYKAKQKGVTTGRPRKPDENVQQAIVMYESKQYTLAEIKAETGISKSTLYRYLEQ
ncbi:recombinase family protein [Gracilibacillus timonensis]|uniref:recombinase family protein n=1 Tax=Gracilibacillus timonensis TaxID=1816696 RepID=UPI0008246B80|nr:recombinase family protein [Gracilibacillus timonensis]